MELLLIKWIVTNNHKNIRKNNYTQNNWLSQLYYLDKSFEHISSTVEGDNSSNS